MAYIYGLYTPTINFQIVVTPKYQPVYAVGRLLWPIPTPRPLPPPNLGSGNPMVWSVCPIRPPIRLFQQCFMETRDHITQTRVLEVTKSLYLLVYLTVLAAVLCYPPYYESPRSVSRVCFVSKQLVSKLFRRNSVETGSISGHIGGLDHLAIRGHLWA